MILDSFSSLISWHSRLDWLSCFASELTFIWLKSYPSCRLFLFSSKAVFWSSASDILTYDLLGGYDAAASSRSLTAGSVVYCCSGGGWSGLGVLAYLLDSNCFFDLFLLRGFSLIWRMLRFLYELSDCLLLDRLDLSLVRCR